MKSICLNALAKINIGLKVLEKRNDGYHNIQTLFYPIQNLYDEIKISFASKNSITGNFPSEINDNNNLILKAKNILEDFLNVKLNCRIEVNKNIPLGAGLGGGSSDAATTLLGLNTLFELNLGKNDLMNLAIHLGSDVPFFINSKPAIGTSRGEILEEFDLEIPYYILLVNPGIHISTKFAFDNIIPANNKLNYLVFDFNSDSNYSNIQNAIINDFENVVFNLYPDIKTIAELMLNEGALFSKMTGTGSTVYGFFKEKYHAMKTVEKLPLKYFHHIEPPYKK
jgi:4-diphosphocytidyl-2-C-methyl-D-erythritol kinase